MQQKIKYQQNGKRQIFNRKFIKKLAFVGIQL